VPNRRGTSNGDRPWPSPVDARADLGDSRDAYFSPRLQSIPPAIHPRELPWWCDERIRDQGEQPSCTGHALAAIVDHLRARDLGDDRANPAPAPGLREPWVSWRMLYAMARYHDEWLGEEYGGSSIRGALKGFYYNGVCSLAAERAARLDLDDPGPHSEWRITKELLESAATIQLGAYYRVRPRLADVHAALSEAGLVLASADIHPGWLHPEPGGTIPYGLRESGHPTGRHAFVLTGFDGDGFWVQNSWGRQWADGGLGRLRYEDWADNLIDMWVLRLAAPDTRRGAHRRPQFARHLGPKTASDPDPAAFARGDDPTPSRLEILGHLIPVSDGTLDQRGHFHAGPDTLRESFRIIRDRRQEDGDYRYRAVLIHFFGARTDERQAALAVRDAVPVFKGNGIYPLFILFESDLCAELFGMFERAVALANQQAGIEEGDAKNRLVEGRMSRAPSRLVHALEASLLSTLAGRYRGGSIRFHLSAHGLGARLAMYFVQAASGLPTVPLVESLSLTAPLLTVQEFREHLAPRVVRRLDGAARARTRRDDLEINRVLLRVLDAACQREDRADPGYGRSLPELWARALALAGGWSGRPSLETLAAGGTGPPRLHLLALPDCAALLDRREMNLRLELLSREDPRLPMPRHRNLDTEPRMLDLLLADILERPGNPRFAAAHRVA